MPTRLLPPALTRAIFSPAELSALRLDGEAVALDEAAVPIDEPVGPVQRAGALGPLLGALVVERESALWVHGFLAACPLVHTAAMPRDARVSRPPSSRRLLVRETNVTPSQLVALGGVRVTVPARTLVDLVLAERFTGPAADGARLMARRIPQAVVAARALLEASGTTPGKLCALTRLGGL